MSLAQLRAHANVGVVGAGVSGLTFAYFLRKLRPDVLITVYEKNAAPGGWINSIQVPQQDPILFEKGPRTLRGVSHGTLLIVDILRRLGRADLVEVMPRDSVANRKYFLDTKGNIVETPHSWASAMRFFTNSISRGVISGILKEPFRLKGPGTDESVRDFLGRRLGTRLVDNLASAGLHGIYAGDVRKLSARSILPGMVEMENEHGSLIWGAVKRKPRPEPEALAKYETHISPGANLAGLKAKLKPYPMLRLEGGLQQLPLALASWLADNNVTIQYNTPLESVTSDGTLNGIKYDHIRSTINVNTLAEVLGLPVGGVNYVDVFLVNLYTRAPILIPKQGHGFGFLVPLLKDNPEKLLGVIYDSDTEHHTKKLFGGHKPEHRAYHKVTLMMGGHFYEEGVPSLEQRLEGVKEVLSQYLHVDLTKHRLIEDPANLNDINILISSNLHRQCIPQFHVGYEDLASSAKSILQNTNILVGGMCYGSGVGVPDCVMNSLEAALSLK